MNASLRILVFQRDGFTCQYCGAKAPDVELHIDHVVPKSKGGSNHPTNLVTACKPCNLGKGAKSIAPPNWREHDLSLPVSEKPQVFYALAEAVVETPAPLRNRGRLCVYCRQPVHEYMFCPECALYPLHPDECLGLHIAESECGEIRAARRSQERALETACIDCSAGNCESRCYDCGSWLCADCSMWWRDERYCSECIQPARAGDPV